MTKQDFLAALSRGLTGLPRRDVRAQLAFYSEMIDDRMEEGLSEQEAVSGIGDISEIAKQVRLEAKQAKGLKARLLPHGASSATATLPIILVILGFPVWLPLLAAFFAVALSLYVTLWALVISLWAACAALALAAVFAVFAGACLTVPIGVAPAAALVGAGSTSAGITIFLYFLCVGATRGTLRCPVRFSHCFSHKANKDLGEWS